MFAQTIAYGLPSPTEAAAVDAIATSSAGSPAFSIGGAGARTFFHSAEFGLLLALVLVAYVDGRILATRR